MVTKRIKDRTIKDIFEELLGEKNANIVLKKIQEQYDKGVKGEELKDFVNRTINEISDLSTDYEKCLVSIIAITVGPYHIDDYLK